MATLPSITLSTMVPVHSIMAPMIMVLTILVRMVMALMMTILIRVGVQEVTEAIHLDRRRLRVWP